MKKNINLKPHVIEKIETKMATRKDISNFQLNFGSNFTDSYKIFEILKNNTDREDFIICGMSEHIVSMVSSLETLLRDIFIYISEEMPEYKDLVINQHKLKIKGKFEEGHSYVLAEMFNFQNIRDIEKAFNLIFKDKNFFEEIGHLEFLINMITQNKISLFSLNKSTSNWFEDLNEIIKIRHKIVHDANFKLDIKIDDIGKYQESVFYFSQVFALYIVRKFNLPHIGVKAKELEYSLPLFLLIEDFDVEIVEVK